MDKMELRTTFKATMKNGVLKDMVNTLSVVQNEVKINVSAEGLTATPVDYAQISMVNLVMYKNAFITFECTDGLSNFGLDLDKVKEVIKIGSSDDIVEMTLDEVNMKVLFKVGKITRHMRAIDPAGCRENKLPALEMNNKITVLASELQNGIKASGDINDHIKLVMDKDKFTYKCESNTDGIDMELSCEDLVSYEISESGAVAKYPMDYFTDIVKAFPSDAELQISMDTDYPLIIESYLDDKQVFAKFLIAPRIEEEE